MKRVLLLALACCTLSSCFTTEGFTFSVTFPPFKTKSSNPEQPPVNVHLVEPQK